jgi:hypothetical protein
MEGIMRRLIVGLAFVLISISLANAAGDPCAEMKQQAQEAVDHGKAGHTETLVKHALAMLEQAKACQKEGVSKASADHLQEAISHQEEAVSHGRQGHGDVALRHAQSALRHAREVKN